MSNPKDAPQRPDLRFVGKVLLAALVVVLLLATWQLAQVFMLGFGGIVVAVALNNMATARARKTGMSGRLALAIGTVTLFGLTFGFMVVFGAGASAQFAALIDRLPAAWEAARNWLETWAV